MIIDGQKAGKGNSDAIMERKFQQSFSFSVYAPYNSYVSQEAAVIGWPGGEVKVTKKNQITFLPLMVL